MGKEKEACNIFIIVYFSFCGKLFLVVNILAGGRRFVLMNKKRWHFLQKGVA